MNIKEKLSSLWDANREAVILILLIGCAIGALICYLLFKGQRPVDVPIALENEVVRVLFVSEGDDGELVTRIVNEKGDEGVRLERPPLNKSTRIMPPLQAIRSETNSFCECYQQYDGAWQCFPNLKHCQ